MIDLSGDAQAKLWEDRQNFIRDEIQLNESRMDEIKALLRETPNSVALNEEVIQCRNTDRIRLTCIAQNRRRSPSNVD